MKTRASILLIFIVFVSIGDVCTSKCNMTCLGSPSGTCVVDETGSITHICAVGCYENPGPHGDAFCTYGPFRCTFYGSIYDFSCWDGLPGNEQTPTVRCSVATWVGHENLSDCRLICAAECGRRTRLTDDCENCTFNEVCSQYASGSTYERACNNTCTGTCESNRQFCDIIELLRYVAMFVGVIMLILHGFKWLVSEDMEGRKDAKKGMIYVMLGLAFIAIASALVELILFDTIIC